ncbi:SART-1 protein [Exophiala viscosa]|uniref:SART-1 protein n=1 Tax=Exophiala viscosa TaxID=2486360 RepID=A0AAN6ICP7_9EURO|nr:SART-1 protein [Exophiala viscosa]KAI1625694.1 SART-1 protein [Exophiala viscosa]
MAAADIEQMNKLRKSLGLPLLSVSGQPPPASEGPTFKEHSQSDDDDSDQEPASTLDTREAAGFENWNQLREEEKRRIEREKRKHEIQKRRDAEARAKRLEGKGLGDADDDADDTKAWLKGQKKRQAKIERERAERLARELAEREKEAANEYSSKDLAGVQVAHEVGDFEDGATEHILTLKDTEIGKDDESDQEDVLENADVLARDKLKEKNELKKKKVYDVNDDSEKALLAQYDEKKRKAFTLDGQGSTVEERDAKRQEIGDVLRNTISLDILKPEPVSDYMEIKIKKPKKAKKTSKRQKMVDEDDEIFPVRTETNGDAMEVDTAHPAPSRSRTTQDNFNDDDDLASALARTRQAVLKKQKRKPEDIIKQMKEEEQNEAQTPEGENGGLVLDDTTVFLDNLSSRPREEEPQRPVVKSIEKEESPEPSEVKNEDEDHPMGEAYSGDNAEELLDRLRREQSTHTPDVSHTGLEEEKTLDQGLGAALGLLRQRGLVKQSEAGDKNALYKDRQTFIIQARLREHENEQKARTQRERDRQSGKLTGLSLKDREEHARWQNTHREHQSSIQAAAAFNREYKPDVQIKYVDDDGRLMNQKEAFKHLSHQFHGKGSGKLKTEKHMKKVAEEKKREAASILDSSEAKGMNNAQGALGKKNKQAGVRLG